MAERRTTSRQRSFLRGSIRLNKGKVALDCLIRDLSVRGARLIFPDMPSIPDIIDVHIPQKNQTLRAHVQWRQGEEVGVTFAAAAAPAANPDDLAARVAQLETELAAMRRSFRRFRASLKAG